MSDQGVRDMGQIPGGMDVLNMLTGEQGADEIALPLDMIRVDGGTQPRDRLDKTAIEEYAADMLKGDRFPAAIVFYDGQDYWLADGFHRWYAAKAVEQSTLLSEVRQGSLRDAILYSAGVNAEHGMRRTNADKRRAVMRLLEDEEWSQWSDREIARRCKVSQPFVSGLRGELSDNGYQIDGDEEPAESPQAYVDDGLPHDSYQAVHDTPLAPQTRRVRRGDGQEYEQRVGSDARRRAAQQRSRPALRPAPKPTLSDGVFRKRIRDQHDAQELGNYISDLLSRGEECDIEVRKA